MVWKYKVSLVLNLKLEILRGKLLLLFTPPTLYFALRAILEPENVLNYRWSEIHALIYFLSFLFFPAVYLYFRKEKIGLICGKKEFLLGLLAYLPFLPLFLLLFGAVIGASGKGFELLNTLILMCLNVSAVDFYVWRVWQANFNRFAGVVVWLIVHIPEATILAPYGVLKVLFFMLFSGIVFSWVYEKSGCVGGLMAGHSAINVGMAFIRGEWW